MPYLTVLKISEKILFGLLNALETEQKLNIVIKFTSIIFSFIN